MEAKQVICKVTEPTSWVSLLVCVEKPNGQLRVCLDPKALNDNACVRGSPNGTIGNFTDGTIGSHGTIGLPLVPMVPLGGPMVPLALPLVPMVLPMVPLVPMVLPMVPLVLPMVPLVEP